MLTFLCQIMGINNSPNITIPHQRNDIIVHTPRTANRGRWRHIPSCASRLRRQRRQRQWRGRTWFAAHLATAAAATASGNSTPFLMIFGVNSMFFHCLESPGDVWGPDKHFFLSSLLTIKTDPVCSRTKEIREIGARYYTRTWQSSSRCDGQEICPESCR